MTCLEGLGTDLTQFDCHHFTKCNEWLEQRYGKGGGIDWDLNVDPGKATEEVTKEVAKEAAEEASEETAEEATEQATEEATN